MVAVVLLVAGVVSSPGGMRPIATAEVTWAVDVASGSSPSVWVMDGLVTIVEAERVVARTPEDGAERWTVPLDDPLCSSDGLRLACVTTDGTDAVITEIDADGSTHDQQIPGVQVATPLGADLVVAGGEMAAPWVERLDPHGEAVWHTDLEGHLEAPETLAFGHLHATDERVLWRFTDGDFIWPIFQAIDPDDGEPFHVFPPARASSSDPDAHVRERHVLESDERDPTSSIVLLQGGVAPGVDEPWLWRWDEREAPLAIDGDTVVTTLLSESLHGAGDEPPDQDGPLHPAAVRFRDLRSGQTLAESDSPYLDVTCPCTATPDGLVARGIRVADRAALDEGQGTVDLVLFNRETASPTWRHPLVTEWGNDTTRLASHGEAVFVLTGGEVVALTAQ
ncbi:PQQ-binding-like beta-propeller repeat protein [Ruania alba]|uniref:Pyrrolo-quinoline quinone repeat domain-containing protein n=1 Tax=Ruania alba TaxID=648782 RepID=A0A1H5BKN1_9MICO|nr:PQQ-binding-like beta-propeller repeat protein [Ruania alba]SED54867.1 hypothetical protein SAMN04488554_0127 [Ruania alba]